MKHYCQANKEKIAEQGKQYRQTLTSKAIRKNASHKRRTKTKQGDVTTKQLLELQLNAKACYWCNCSLGRNMVHIDHYVPLSKGGEHTISNLVVACRKCNLAKHAKDPIIFAKEMGKLL
jgi:5-methylcytosine-specific restriction endonuclease McrA